MTGSPGAPGRPSLTLVVPLYNEQDRFLEHADELVCFIAGFDAPSRLIFVDDGSHDATVETVQAYLDAHPGVPARLLRRSHRGKGAAVRAGLELADGRYAGFCDIDLSTPLGQLELVVRAAARNRVLAIGSRDLSASRLLHPQGRVRELLGKSYNRLVQLTLTPGISDTQCGAKVAETELWRAILAHCRQDGFAWDVEAISVARRLGVVVREVAIEWSHDDRSRVRVGRDGAAMVAAVPRIMAGTRRVRGPGLDRDAGGVFDDRQASTLIESDTGHWWFRSKGAFVASVLRSHPQPGRTPLLIDVGAGAGGVTSILGWPPDRLGAVEGSEELVRVARRRHSLPAAMGSTTALPIRAEGVGVITVLDVLEHLEDPVGALREAHRALRGEGQLVVTVPAHAWLWSSADEVLGHVRRYTRPLLRAQLREAGFEPVVLTHVFSWLVGPVWLQRRLAKDADASLGLDRTSFLLDRLALVLTGVERMVTRRVSLPVGTSILCLAVKQRPAAGPPPTHHRPWTAPGIIPGAATDSL